MAGRGVDVPLAELGHRDADDAAVVRRRSDGGDGARVAGARRRLRRHAHDGLVDASLRRLLLRDEPGPGLGREDRLTRGLLGL